MNNPDFLLWTDGSGHTDGYGGWAAYARTLEGTHQLFRMGALVGTTVDRAELTGIIEGLDMVMELAMSIPRKVMIGQMGWKPRVKMYSDRESLVLSIQGVNNRNSSPDLWRRFEYYESHMVLDINHVARESDWQEFLLVDLHASSARVMIKNYAESCSLPAHLPPKIT